MARGKTQTPTKTAPVSGPGALSTRTDKQPTRVPTGGAYGEAKASREQQQSAPLAVAGGGPPPRDGGPIPPPPDGGVFGPTAKPGEAPTAGIQPRGTNPGDVDMTLRNIYSVFPHPQILKLLRRSGG